MTELAEGGRIGRALALVLSRLGHERRGRKRWTAICPTHRRERIALTIRLARDGKVLLGCASGCRAVSIARRLGLAITELSGTNAKEGRQ